MKSENFLEQKPPVFFSHVVIGIDPGEVSAISILTTELQPKLLMCGTCTLKQLLDRPTALAMIASNMTVDLVAIEDQYVSINKRSAIVLSRSAGCWQLAAAIGALPTAFINPTSWQQKELGGSISRLSLSEQRKITSIAKCKALWKKEMNEHEADASLIARYVAVELCHGRQKEKIGRGTRPNRTRKAKRLS